MGRIAADGNDEWLEAARTVLGTDTKLETINAGSHAVPLRRRVTEILAAFDEVRMDFEGSAQAWGYVGGRDLSKLEVNSRAAAP